MNGWLLFHTLMGTLLVASGTGTLNQYLERRTDAFMRRTAKRPLAGGTRLRHREACGLESCSPSAAGRSSGSPPTPSPVRWPLLRSPPTSSCYTPLKRRTPLCTVVGAFPGAMPPLIGWAAVRNGLSAQAWVLYAILFLWQFPHLLAIAWMYREDYARAGLQMLPRNDDDGRATVRQILACTLALLPVSLIPAFSGHAGTLYVVSAAMLGAGFLYYGARLAARRTNVLARQLLMASILYLPLVFAVLMFDRK